MDAILHFSKSSGNSLSEDLLLSAGTYKKPQDMGVFLIDKSASSGLYSAPLEIEKQVLQKSSLDSASPRTGLGLSKTEVVGQSRVGARRAAQG